MRIGYLFRGFLGDLKLDRFGKEVSTPDGNATYSWSIEHECHRRKHRLVPLGENLDAPACTLLGGNAFSAFSRDLRSRSYERMLRRGWAKGSDRMFPELDLVLVEWRWPIKGRNTPDDRHRPEYQRDLERQTAVLRYYSTVGTPIVVWDLDHKLTAEDERMWAGSIRVIETSADPRQLHLPRTRVEPPFVTSELLQHPIDRRRPSWDIGYIGSRYERDDVIDEWIAPGAPKGSHRVHFWGKWEPADEVRARWPGVRFSGRIGVAGFYGAYSRVAAVPLLAKRSYLESGFITPRPWEAVLFGSVPVGLGSHRGIGQYTDLVAADAAGLYEHARHLRNVSQLRREVYREEAAHKLSQRVDVRGFLDTLESLAGGGRQQPETRRETVA